MLGAHVSFTAKDFKGLADAVKYYHENGLGCIQIFYGSQQSCTRRKSDDDDLDAARLYMMKHSCRLYTHSNLCMNLCSGEDYVRDTLLQELYPVNRVGGSTVVHFGSKNVKGSPTGTLDNMVQCLKSLHLEKREEEKCQPFSLLVENSAGEGSKYGSNIWDIGKVVNNVDGVGLCLDTAHMFGGGMCEFNTIAAVKNCLYLVDSMVGRDKLQLIHLNDSKVPFNSKNDRHENLGEGKIWSSGTDTLVYLRKACKERNIDMILETPNPPQDLALMAKLT